MKLFTPANSEIICPVCNGTDFEPDNVGHIEGFVCKCGLWKKAEDWQKVKTNQTGDIFRQKRGLFE